MRGDCTDKRSCETCFYFDKCASDNPCWAYTPLYEDEEEELEEIIEKRRGKFRNEFFAYVSEYDDDLFW